VNILLDTLVDDASSQPAVPDTGPAVERMGWYLRALAKFLTEEPAGKVLLALIGEAQHDPVMALVFHQRYLDPQRERERALLRRGITAGELSAVLDIGAALDALCGPVIYRPLTGTQIPVTVIDGLTADILERCAAWRAARGHGDDSQFASWTPGLSRVLVSVTRIIGPIALTVTPPAACLPGQAVTHPSKACDPGLFVVGGSCSCHRGWCVWLIKAHDRHSLSRGLPEGGRSVTSKA
jgi:hypothetical protein